MWKSTKTAATAKHTNAGKIFSQFCLIFTKQILNFVHNKIKMNMQVLLPTPKQAERAARDRKIVADYNALRKAYPTAPVMSIVRTIAARPEYGLKPEGVRRVLTATGDIRPKSRA